MLNNKFRILDLFCGAGGAGVGYAQAGFDVTGVDLLPQKNYPYTFIQADALTFPLDGFDAIHASPPCQGYSVTRNLHSKEYPMLIDAMRKRMVSSGKPWIIENVMGAPMGHFLMLCGTYFGLKVYRHRQFETSILMFAPGQCTHPSHLLPDFYTIFGDTIRGSKKFGRHKAHIADGRAAMAIDWMTTTELCQAIPPAYTHYIGGFLLDAVLAERQVAS